MRKKVLLWFLIVGFIQSAYCNDSISSKVIIYREDDSGGYSNSFQISDGDFMIGRLKNKTYFIYNCKPGVHDFLIEKSNINDLEINTEPGEIYYIRFDIQMGKWSSAPEFNYVDSISACSKINKGKLHKIEISNSKNSLW